MDLQNLEIELLTLRHELHQLKIKTQGQEDKIIEQASIINKITTENQELKNKLLRLQDKLNINSSNSGLPTSKEVYRIERKSKSKSERKVGGQKGHKYSGYQFKTPDKIIDVIKNFDETLFKKFDFTDGDNTPPVDTIEKYLAKTKGYSKIENEEIIIHYPFKNI